MKLKTQCGKNPPLAAAPGLHFECVSVQLSKISHEDYIISLMVLKSYEISSIKFTFIPN